MTDRIPNTRDLFHLLDLQLSFQQLLAAQLHGEASSGKEHGVPVPSLFGSDPGLSFTFPGNGRSTAVTGDGEAAGQEPACMA